MTLRQDGHSSTRTCRQLVSSETLLKSLGIAANSTVSSAYCRTKDLLRVVPRSKRLLSVFSRYLLKQDSASTSQSCQPIRYIGSCSRTGYRMVFFGRQPIVMVWNPGFTYWKSYHVH